MAAGQRWRLAHPKTYSYAAVTVDGCAAAVRCEFGVTEQRDVSCHRRGMPIDYRWSYQEASKV